MAFFCYSFILIGVPTWGEFTFLNEVPPPPEDVTFTLLAENGYEAMEPEVEEDVYHLEHPLRQAGSKVIQVKVRGNLQAGLNIIARDASLTFRNVKFLNYALD